MSIRVGLRPMRRPSVGALCPKPRYLECRIFSTYSLCSTIPFEELVAQPTSAYNLCIPQKEYLTAIPTSDYDLSTAVT